MIPQTGWRMHGCLRGASLLLVDNLNAYFLGCPSCVLADGGRLLATMVVGERGKALLAQFYQKHSCIAVSDVTRRARQESPELLLSRVYYPVAVVACLLLLLASSWNVPRVFWRFNIRSRRSRKVTICAHNFPPHRHNRAAMFRLRTPLLDV